MMSGAKAPDLDACGLFRATHSHNPTRYEQAHVGLDLLTLVSLNRNISRTGDRGRIYTGEESPGFIGQNAG